MNDLHDFITDLLIEAGFNLDQHKDMIQEIEPVLLRKIVTKLIIKLSPEFREQAEGHLTKGNAEKFQGLCMQNIPSYDEYFASILEEFKEEYLSNFQE